MVNVEIEGFRMGWFVRDYRMDMSFRESILIGEFLRDYKGKEFFHGLEGSVIELLEMLFFFITEFDQGFHVFVCEIRIIFPVRVAFGKIGSDLFKRNLKGIADVMQKGCHSPESQKRMGCFTVFFPVVFVRAEAVERFKCFAEIFVGFINSKAQCEDINRVGVMITVFHQQGAGVGFKFRKQFDHFLGLGVPADKKDFKIAVINGVSVFRAAGIDKGFQFPFQTEPVEIHLHVVGNLPFFDSDSPTGSGFFFFLFNIRVEPKAFTAVVQKTQRRGFQV